MSDFYRRDKHVVDKQTEEGDIGVFNKKDILFLTFHFKWIDTFHDAISISICSERKANLIRSRLNINAFNLFRA